MVFHTERFSAGTGRDGVGVFEDETFGKESVFVVQNGAGQEKQALFVHVNRQIFQVNAMVVGGGGASPGFEVITEPRTSSRRDLDAQSPIPGRTGRQERFCLRRGPVGDFEQGSPGRRTRRRKTFHSHRRIWRWDFGWQTHRRKNLLCSRSRPPPGVGPPGDPPTF